MQTIKKLNRAMKVKNDEFYTRRSDIENELKHYKKHFKNKIVFLNCDDPRQSEFFFFFKMKFYDWQLKKLIATHYQYSPLYNNSDYNRTAYKIELTEVDQYGENGKEIETPLKENGDFQSKECIKLLQEADIVCTNPPFSLFRQYIEQLMKYKKQFLIIGNLNAIKYKNIFKNIFKNKIWTGYNRVNHFINKKNEQVGSPAIWFTNLQHKKRNQEQKLFKKYDSELHPHFDHLNAINIDKTCNIPKDYDGIMGVPISFLLNYNPQQFEVIDAINNNSVLYGTKPENKNKYLSQVNGKVKYTRILIKRKNI